jgi:hypothetical protein
VGAARLSSNTDRVHSHSQAPRYPYTDSVDTVYTYAIDDTDANAFDDADADTVDDADTDTVDDANADAAAFDAIADAAAAGTGAVYAVTVRHRPNLGRRGSSKKIWKKGF